MKKNHRQTTKLLSYNISYCTQKKVDPLLDYDADILIVPELAYMYEVTSKKDYEVAWSGDFNQKGNSKGLGMIWKKGDAYIPAWYNENLRFAIPLFYKDLLVIAIWPTKCSEDKNQTYLQLAEEIIKYYAPYFTEKKIITGDFNLYYKKGVKNKDADILPLNALLESYGFFSAYHKINGEECGKESVSTYFHQFKQENPFFLDYTYTNFSIKNYDLLPWNKDISDHVGQIIEI